MGNKARRELFNYIDSLIIKKGRHDQNEIYLEWDDLSAEEKESIAGHYISFFEEDIDSDFPYGESHVTLIAKYLKKEITGNEFKVLTKGMFREHYAKAASDLIEERIQYLLSL